MTSPSKQTQMGWVKSQLGLYGEVSRNQALRNFITRLGSRIYDLKKEGFVFKVERRGSDYWYVVESRP